MLEAATHHSRARVVSTTALAALAVCMALQIWRPYFFLTNDNLTQWMPPMVEIERNLLDGKPAFISASLFGGGYDWRTDASIFPMISPLVPLLAPLAASQWYFLIVDLIVTFEFIVIAGAFAYAAVWLRDRHQLPLSDAVIVLASLSYAFSPIMLLFGSSWMGFANAQGAWPLVFVAMQFASFWRSAAVLSAAFAFSLFGGNLHPFTFLLLGSGFCAVYFSIATNSLRPALALAAAVVTVALIAWFVLGPTGETILETGKLRAFKVERASALNVPVPALLESFLLGPFSAPVGGPRPFFGVDSAWSAAMAYSLVNIPLLVAIMRGGWRSKRTRVLLLIVAALAVLIWRPHWMGEIFESLPVIRSTRWPFREIIVLLFFVHLLFIYSYRPLPRRWNATQWVFAWLPMLLLLRAGPPTMGSVELSRKLIISGAADSYWTAMGPLSSKLPSVAATDLDTSGGIDASAPYPLLPSHNFPALFGVRSVSGYSTGTPLWLDPHRIFPPTLTGIFSLDEARIYLAHFPAARLTVLHSVDPPVWSIVGHESGRTLTIDPDTLAIRDAPPP